MEIFRKGKGLLRVLEAHLPVPVLEKVIQLPEHLGQVAPVDLVDHQVVVCSPLCPRPFGNLEKWSVPDGEPGPSLRGHRGAVPLHEVLVGVGRVELHQRDPVGGSGEGLGQFLGDIGLARAGRALEDDLLLVAEQPGDALQERGRQVQLSGQGVEAGLGRSPIIILATGPSPLVDDCPDHRLGIETVAQFQPPGGRFLDEPVEESQGMPVNGRFIPVRFRAIVAGELVGRIEHAHSERWKLLGIQPHQEDGDDRHASARAAGRRSGKESAELGDPLGEIQIVPGPEGMQGNQGIGGGLIDPAPEFRLGYAEDEIAADAAFGQIGPVAGIPKHGLPRFRELLADGELVVDLLDFQKARAHIRLGLSDKPVPRPACRGRTVPP